MHFANKYAYVCYADPWSKNQLSACIEADNAKSQLDGKRFEDETLVIDFYRKHQDRHKISDQQPESSAEKLKD